MASRTKASHLSRRDVLKAGLAAGAGFATLASPLGTMGVAVARRAQVLASQPLSTAPVTLRFMTRGNSGYPLFFKAAVAAFTKINPNVTINIENPTDFDTKLKVEIAGGDPPDVAFQNDDYMLSYAATGAQMDLAPFFAASGLKRSDFWPAALNPQWLGPHLFAMPLDFGIRMLFYNKALFDAQHLSYPTTKWTWNDFAQVASRLTVDRNGKRATDPGFEADHVRQYGEEGGLGYDFLDILRANGGDWATPDLSKSLLDSPVSISTFQWITDMMNKRYTSPSPAHPTSVSFALDYSNVAIGFEGTWAFGEYRAIPQLKWNDGGMDILPMPLGTKGRAVSGEASGLIIPHGVKPENARWAWEFIKWMTTEPGQRVAFSYGVATVPCVKSVAEELIPTLKRPNNHSLILQYLPQARSPFWVEAISDQTLENMLTSSPYSGAPEMLDLFKGKKTAAEVMPSVSKKVQAVLDGDQLLAKKLGAHLHL